MRGLGQKAAGLKRLDLGAFTLRTLGPGSVAALLKVALDVVYGLLWVILGLCFVLLVAAFFIPLDDFTVTVDDGRAFIPLTRGLAVFAVLSGGAYFGAFLLIVQRLRLVFVTLAQGDPFQPENTRRLRQIGLILAVVTGAQASLRYAGTVMAPTLFNAPSLGDLMTPIFSLLIVFVLAEVFREGARLRRDAELTI